MLNYVAVLNGVRPPNLEQSFTYLELGSGFGTSAVVNAGAFPRGEFHACDFNAAHIAGGKSHAAALGTDNIQFHQASFAELSSLDLPPFDFIVAHGVYSCETLVERLETEIRRRDLKIMSEGRELQPGAELSNYVRLTAYSVTENLLPNLARLGLFV